jgi:hypothetical protein
MAFLCNWRHYLKTTFDVQRLGLTWLTIVLLVQAFMNIRSIYCLPPKLFGGDLALRVDQEVLRDLGDIVQSRRRSLKRLQIRNLRQGKDRPAFSSASDRVKSFF